METDAKLLLRSAQAGFSGIGIGDCSFEAIGKGYYNANRAYLEIGRSYVERRVFEDVLV